MNMNGTPVTGKRAFLLVISNVLILKQKAKTKKKKNVTATLIIIHEFN